MIKIFDLNQIYPELSLTNLNFSCLCSANTIKKKWCLFACQNSCLKDWMTCIFAILLDHKIKYSPFQSLECLVTSSLYGTVLFCAPEFHLTVKVKTNSLESSASCHPSGLHKVASPVTNFLELQPHPPSMLCFSFSDPILGRGGEQRSYKN